MKEVYGLWNKMDTDESAIPSKYPYSNWMPKSGTVWFYECAKEVDKNFCKCIRKWSLRTGAAAEESPLL